MKDYYGLLNVSRDATKDEIAKAYRQLARQYHPDINKDPDAAEKFKEIVEAYEVLSDDRKRAGYNSRTSNRPFSGGPMDDMFESIFNRWAEFSGNEPPKNKGQSIRTSVQVELKELLKGCKKEVTYSSQDICPTCKGQKASSWERCAACNGNGRISMPAQIASWNVETTCPQCRGMGKVPKEICDDCSGTGLSAATPQKVEVNVPPGCEDGIQIRMDGLGGAGISGVNGDLYVVVHVKPDM
jgi:molecular chaperone DnaJ